MSEYATVAAITRDDLLNWHKQYVQPNNIIFGITGDFDPKAMEAKLRQAFESWPKGPAAKPPDIKFTDPKPGYYLVKKSDVNQSSINLISLGIKRDNPDYFAVSVMNEIFGGGFSSRLVQQCSRRPGSGLQRGRRRRRQLRPSRPDRRRDGDQEREHGRRHRRALQRN